MRQKKPKTKCPDILNPVAKYAARFNRAEVFKDKTVYRRKEKHRRREPSLIGSIRTYESRLVLPSSPMSRRFMWLLRMTMRHIGSSLIGFHSNQAHGVVA